jgi:hypothetical protein
MMEAVTTSETSVNLHRTTHRNIFKSSDNIKGSNIRLLLSECDPTSLSQQCAKTIFSVHIIAEKLFTLNNVWTGPKAVPQSHQSAKDA